MRSRGGSMDVRGSVDKENIGDGRGIVGNGGWERRKFLR